MENLLTSSCLSSFAGKLVEDRSLFSNSLEQYQLSLIHMIFSWHGFMEDNKLLTPQSNIFRKSKLMKTSEIIFRCLSVRTRLGITNKRLIDFAPSSYNQTLIAITCKDYLPSLSTNIFSLINTFSKLIQICLHLIQIPPK
jgi:hypothetical protein